VHVRSHRVTCWSIGKAQRRVISLYASCYPPLSRNPKRKQILRFYHLISKFQNRTEPENYLCHQAQDTAEL